MDGGGKGPIGFAQFYNAAAVDDGDIGRNVTDYSEVVAHVNGTSSVRMTKPPHRFEDVTLNGHIESRRRFVQHDHARTTSERNCQRYPLLLSPRQLVGVTPEHLLFWNYVHIA
jgi:hypothetical protein